MRVLMVSDVYFPRINGVSTSIETFRHALGGDGIEVRLVAPRYGTEADADRVLRVPSRPVPRDPEDRLVGWKAMHRQVLAAAEHCDVVHVQTPFVAHYAGVAAARRRGVPVIGTYHTLFEEYAHHYAPLVPAGLLRALARRYSRAQCNALDAVVVPSRSMRDRLAQYRVSAPLHVLPTGIPLERFCGGDGIAFRRHHGIDAKRPLALYVGRVAHEKNIDFLLRVVRDARRRMPEMLLVIAGEGPALSALQSRAHAMGIEDAVRFVGYLERERALPDCYAAADAFVFASRTETQGLVLLEAMAAGVPVVALAAMGTADILAPRRGCRVSADDVEEFAAALVEVLDDASLRAVLGAQAQAYAQTWSDRAMAHRLAALYRQLVARPTAWKAHSKARPA